MEFVPIFYCDRLAPMRLIGVEFSSSASQWVMG